MGPSFHRGQAPPAGRPTDQCGSPTDITRQGRTAAVPSWDRPRPADANLTGAGRYYLDSSPVQTKTRLIDYELLRVRNEIAHGQYLSVDADSHEELHLEVLGIMDFVRNTVGAAAENQTCRRRKEL
ncbi:MAE_28990/MAE_18760 family HEPN-like nuclease [Streptomyces sp. NPDC002589]|uniref:MAE_28990/MAE_18760 family HEPN-like nuclease n=1 Tax=Streptomyces sp. NPDC002589 TaxID=3154420 RepID=UPI00332392E6